jgi:hypothetical protein
MKAELLMLCGVATVRIHMRSEWTRAAFVVVGGGVSAFLAITPLFALPPLPAQKRSRSDPRRLMSCRRLCELEFAKMNSEEKGSGKSQK